jgi:hypothetical protein
MKDVVESVWEIKIDKHQLELAADNRNQKVKKLHQIGNYRFGGHDNNGHSQRGQDYINKSRFI